MITLTPPQWRAFTYVRQGGNAWCNSADVQLFCGIESRKVARRVLNELRALGLVRRKMDRNIYKYQAGDYRGRVGVAP